MKGKMLFLWRSDEAQLERLTNTKPINNVFQATLQDWEGKPATLTLTDGNKIRVIIVSCSYKIVAVTVTALPVKLIIPTREIVSVKLNGKNSDS